MPWCPDQNVVRVVDEFFEVLTLATRRLVKFYPAVCNLQDSELRKVGDTARKQLIEWKRKIEKAQHGQCLLQESQKNNLSMLRKASSKLKELHIKAYKFSIDDEIQQDALDLANIRYEELSFRKLDLSFTLSSRAHTEDSESELESDITPTGYEELNYDFDLENKTLLKKSGRRSIIRF